MTEEIKDKHKRCIACRNAGKNLKSQIPLTEKSKIITNEPGEEIQLDFTGDLISDKIPNKVKILVAIDHFSKWPTAKICKNTETKTVTEFLENHFNLHGLPKRIRTDKDSAFISQEYKDFCKEKNIHREIGLPYMHTATGLVERTIQTLKNLLLANLERNKLNRKLKSRITRNEIYRTYRKRQNTIRNALRTETKNKTYKLNKPKLYAIKLERYMCFREPRAIAGLHNQRHQRKCLRSHCNGQEERHYRTAGTITKETTKPSIGKEK